MNHEFTDTELKIIIAMIEGNSDYYYPYRYYEAETGLDRKELKSSMDNLRKLGIMGYARGLMSDEGEVVGSGFGIADYEKFKEASKSAQASTIMSEFAERESLEELLVGLGLPYSGRRQAVKEVLAFMNRRATLNPKAKGEK